MLDRFRQTRLDLASGKCAQALVVNADAGEEALAQEQLRPFQAPALAEVVLPRDEDFLDQLRILEEVAVARSGPEAYDVPRVFARDPAEELERM